MTTQTVYDYLRTQNRPFSVNDIVSNLGKDYGKTAVQKALDHLVENGKIFEKTYGKQKIYCVTQNSKDDTHELMRIDKELQAHANEVETKLQSIQKEIKTSEDKLLSLKSSITLEEAKRQKVALKERIQSLMCKLDELMDSAGSEDLSVAKGKAENALSDYTREYKKRKRLCTDVIDCILENYPGSKKQLYEEIGIEEAIVD